MSNERPSKQQPEGLGLARRRPLIEGEMNSNQQLLASNHTPPHISPLVRGLQESLCPAKLDQTEPGKGKGRGGTG